MHTQHRPVNLDIVNAWPFFTTSDTNVVHLNVKGCSLIVNETGQISAVVLVSALCTLGDFP